MIGYANLRRKKNPLWSLSVLLGAKWNSALIETDHPKSVCLQYHLVQHLEGWQGKPEAQRGQVTCLRLPSQITLQGPKSDTPQWVSFLLLQGGTWA